MSTAKAWGIKPSEWWRLSNEDKGWMMAYDIANNQITNYIDEQLEALYKRDRENIEDQGHKGLKGCKRLRRR